ncbi:hypothetical protein CAMRE0001_2269 [Campylobacter rectus RM3267]|uniref:Uncharacterized protein n=1 Tax=Campylobacter rectus RM3267 TaxID=553218 RepID=B9D598_CAMRE|nr:hypothetical protein CAMRE0001_2269 [Campylobacter rectus RM3267]
MVSNLIKIKTKNNKETNRRQILPVTRQKLSNLIAETTFV